MSQSSPASSLLFQNPLRLARKLVVFVLGGSVLLIGIALIVLPGPAILVIPAGLAILASEFAWARSLLAQVRERSTRLSEKLRRPRRSL